MNAHICGLSSSFTISSKGTRCYIKKALEYIELMNREYMCDLDLKLFQVPYLVIVNNYYTATDNVKLNIVRILMAILSYNLNQALPINHHLNNVYGT